MQRPRGLPAGFRIDDVSEHNSGALCEESRRHSSSNIPATARDKDPLITYFFHNLV
jgi:hypothetical protein